MSFSAFIKSSSEQQSRGFDMTGKLPTGVTIVSCTVSAWDRTMNVQDNTVLSSTTAVITSAVEVSILCQGGVNGKNYKIDFQMVLSDGQHWQEDALTYVVDA